MNTVRKLSQMIEYCITKFCVFEYPNFRSHDLPSVPITDALLCRYILVTINYETGSNDIQRKLSERIAYYLDKNILGIHD